MSKLIYVPQRDYFVNVGLINFETCLSEELFEVIISDEKLQRITNYLQDSRDCNIVCFPEFSYNESLFELYNNFSNEYGVIVLGGSGLEQIDDEHFYAYCPIFFSR